MGQNAPQRRLVTILDNLIVVVICLIIKLVSLLTNKYCEMARVLQDNNCCYNNFKCSSVQEVKESQMRGKNRILVVDDEEAMGLGLAEILTNAGHEVQITTSGKEAIEKVKKYAYDVVLTDLKMPDVDGIQVLEQVKKSSPETAVIMLTAYGTVASAVEAIKKGAYDYISKPFKIDQVRNIVNKALQQRISTDECSSFRTISRMMHPEYDGRSKVIEVRGVKIGGSKLVIIAGPCAVEGREFTLEIARAVKESGADMLRGGAYKPRTSPYDFQGLGEEGLEILAEAREITGLPVVTEVMDPRLVDLVGQYADVYQIGSRSMQNFPLLTEVGKTKKPVLLKRGMSATLREWLCAAEYIAKEGNTDIILCERGVRTAESGEYDRNTLDLNVIGAVKKNTYLPIIVDPSHGTGRADMVPLASKAAVEYGAQGLIIEVIGENMDVQSIKSDGYQSIRPSILRNIIEEVSAKVLNF